MLKVLEGVEYENDEVGVGVCCALVQWASSLYIPNSPLHGDGLPPSRASLEETWWGRLP